MKLCDLKSQLLLLNDRCRFIKVIKFTKNDDFQQNEHHKDPVNFKDSLKSVVMKPVEHIMVVFVGF